LLVFIYAYLYVNKYVCMDEYVYEYTPHLTWMT